MGPWRPAKRDNERSEQEDEARARRATWEERLPPVELDERARAQAAWRAVKEEEAVVARHCKLDRAATRKSADSDIFARLTAGKSQVDAGDAKGAAPEDSACNLKHTLDNRHSSATTADMVARRRRQARQRRPGTSRQGGSAWPGSSAWSGGTRTIARRMGARGRNPCAAATIDSEHSSSTTADVAARRRRQAR